MSIVSKLFEVSPYPELFARKIYYSFFRERAKIKKANGAKHYSQNAISNVEIIKLVEHLKELGIHEGDLLIVHSSAYGLNMLNCRENVILDELINLVGKNGTIVFPAFPDESRLKERDGIKIYDCARSVAWTGMLPNLLLRKKGSIRSQFPYNPLVAYGTLAEDMMKDNSDEIYAHGPRSAWGYCVEHHAKILFLGLPAYHSCTILHTIEDYQPDYWPNDWYTTCDYIVRSPNDERRLTVKIRDIKWAKYMAERFTEHKYIKAGLIQKSDYQGITIRYIEDSNSFVNTILSDWNQYRFFYLPKNMENKHNKITKI